MRKLILRKRNDANETMNMLGEQFTVLAAGEETGSTKCLSRWSHSERDRHYTLIHGTRCST